MAETVASTESQTTAEQGNEMKLDIIMDIYNLSALPDLTNDKGHGFLSFEYDGMLHHIPPPMAIDRKLYEEQITQKSLEGHMRALKERSLQDDDIIIAAYPKTGTHWLWEIVVMLKTGSLTYSAKPKESQMMEFMTSEAQASIPAPRVLNTHMPFRFLPTDIVDRKLKVIQIMRNPKDTCVSMFHHFSEMVNPIGYDGDFQEFTEAYLSGRLPCSSYHYYIKMWFNETEQLKDLPILHIYYEDLKRNPAEIIRTVANFLDVEVSDEFCRDVGETCSFSKLKSFDKAKRENFTKVKIWKDGSMNSFFRKGIVGDWKNWFTVAENEKFDEIWNDKMQDSTIEFKYTEY